MKKNLIKATLLTIILGLFATPSYSTSIPDGDDKQMPRNSWANNWLGFKVEASANDIGVNFRHSDFITQDGFIPHQIGGRLQLGLILDKQSDSPIVFVVGFAKAKNIDSGTIDTLSATSLLDLGLEYPLWIILNQNRSRFSFDIGAFASSCKVLYENTEYLRKWGVAGRISLSYNYKLHNGLVIGCKLYDHFGSYFGAKGTDYAQFSGINEMGLSVCLSF